MKIPRSVRVCGRSFTVLLEDNPDFVGNLSGQVDLDNLLIRISSGLAGGEERETLLHELIHVIDRCLLRVLTEEDVRRLSNGLFAVLRDNPKLVAYLMEEK